MAMALRPDFSSPGTPPANAAATPCGVVCAWLYFSLASDHRRVERQQRPGLAWAERFVAILLACRANRARSNVRLSLNLFVVGSAGNLSHADPHRPSQTCASRHECNHLVTWESAVVSHRAVRRGRSNRAKLFCPRAVRRESCLRTRMRHGGLPSTSTMAPGMR